MTKDTIYIKTWGCQMNEYDSSMITQLLLNKYHFKKTNIPELANILILNTCSIREKAQEKVFHQLGRWRKLKEKNPAIIIAVGGCVAVQEGEEIYKRANYVDIVFGTQTLHKLPEMIKQVKNKNKHIIDITFPVIEKFDFIEYPKFPGVTAYVTIIEGCNKFCSFCIVPYTRGHEISRPVDELLLEISILAERGVREVNLLGQNVNAYKGKTFDGKICQFSELLRLVALIDGIDRIRFTTSNPIEFTDDIIDVYSDTKKVVSFLHLPVQSGSDRILKMMKRAHNVKEYKDIIKKIIKARPNIQISSDFIVGFPGETQEDFEKTLQLIKEINFDASFSFIYSSRPGTPASDLLDTISIEEKKKRLYVLQNLIKQNTKIWNEKMLGSIQTVLIEGPSHKNPMELSGRTENNRIVNFEGKPNMIGHFINLKITKINSNSLRGHYSKKFNN
ncbi:tRNA (N6-isopentenyl adenosine(37)-C2)-methylthiotransferase MiaB [Buchnera aphidicola]|uniref:tRNA-2-methylthio-N(6)-dimethylallyladenosine synthase n=1 Tax=Buchnera aphidicola subsp. Melaphis rhois TaxID=118103 RepID=A0A4D6Y1B2_BUCMH|nr:tRNA (N6-isopentenyl adenosine(37)-C2)-methylthiotransferase MiaB [Buchnera aphidicola]QCI23402.1 tRNA (N6-isopentenyl adenosine(37)-C2)-methylthiotransferase MiaB [Buchnera aphidicola (Melaphis rhois)]